MPDNKNTQQELAYELYCRGYKYADIAEQVGCSLSAVKSWAYRIWKNKKSCKEKLQPKQEKVAKKLQPKKYKTGMHPNSRNGTGPPGNRNAEKYGFFSKVLPEETLELVNGINIFSPIEVLWQNIQIQYAAILRAQKIMYVENEHDMSKEIISDTSGKVDSVSYQIQHAWDKQANFLQAQSRAMQSLNTMIKQYDDLMRSELVTEEQKARIEVLKAKVDNINSNDVSDSIDKLDELIRGIGGIANGVD